MNRLIAIFALILLPFLANAKDYEEGKHFTVVQGKEVSSPEVREYFSFYCPHCFKYEPLVAMIKSRLPKDVAFKKNHVNFAQGASVKMQKTLTRALNAAYELEAGEEAIAAIFKYIHVHRAVFTSERDVRNVFVMAGIDGAAFDKAMSSEEVATLSAEMNAHQEELSKTKGITGVPAVVVNGKYRIETGNLDRTSLEAFEADYMGLVNYLLAKK